MPITLLASFPNSRLMLRSPTQTAITGTLSPSSIVGALDRVVYANQNRTYLYLFNASGSPIWYFYLLAFENVNPTVTPTFGLVGDLIQNSVTGDLYRKIVSDGTNTNWSLIAPADYILVGNEVATGTRSIEITSREMVVVTTNGVILPAGTLTLEYGVG